MFHGENVPIRPLHMYRQCCGIFDQISALCAIHCSRDNFHHLNQIKISTLLFVISTFKLWSDMCSITAKGVDPDTKVGGMAYMSTQREVLEGQTGSHRAKRANFGRGVRGSSPGKFQKPTWQMVQSTLFLSYICE